MEQKIKVGDYCKHYKGKNLIEKNIYQILEMNVTYSGDNANRDINDLVIYNNVYQHKIFAREANDIFSELSEDKQKEFGQKYRVQKLTNEELKEINTKEFKEKKIINKKTI